MKNIVPNFKYEMDKPGLSNVSQIFASSAEYTLPASGLCRPVAETVRPKFNDIFRQELAV